MTWAWRIWWSLGLLLPFLHWPRASIWESGRWLLAGWAVAAGILALCEAQPRRKAAVPILAVLLAWLAFRHAVVAVPQLIWDPWTSGWGIFAAFSALWWWVVGMTFGTQAVLRYAPDPRKWLGPVLFSLLLLNFFVYSGQHLDSSGEAAGWSIWKYRDINAGLFPNTNIWAGWCVLSLPFLWAWKKWAIAPALLGLAFGESS